MSNDSDSNITYWKTKYSLLEEQFRQQKTRNEDLEDRLLDMVEKVETDKLTLSSEIDGLNKKLEEANRKISELNGICNRFEKGCTCNLSHAAENTQSNASETDVTQCTEEPEDPVIIDRPRTRIVLADRKVAPSDRGYHHFPVLALEQGFIYGFTWEKGSVVKVV